MKTQKNVYIVTQEFNYELSLALVLVQLQLEGRSLEFIPSTTAERFQHGDPA